MITIFGDRINQGNYYYSEFKNDRQLVKVIKMYIEVCGIKIMLQ